MVDKNSPFFFQYWQECMELHKEIHQKLDELYARDPDYRGRDREGINEIYKEENARLKKLQKKYGFYEGEVEPCSPPPPLSDAEKEERTKKVEEELEALLKEWGLR